jgi:hypothetical protein
MNRGEVNGGKSKNESPLSEVTLLKVRPLKEGTLIINPVQVQKWSFALEKTTDLALNLV